MVKMALVILCGLLLLVLTVELLGVWVQVQRGDTGNICGPLGIVCIYLDEPWDPQGLVLPPAPVGLLMRPAPVVMGVARG